MLVQTATVDITDVDVLKKEIERVGNQIRQMKTSQANKVVIKSLIITIAYMIIVVRLL